MSPITVGELSIFFYFKLYSRQNKAKIINDFKGSFFLRIREICSPV